MKEIFIRRFGSADLPLILKIERLAFAVEPRSEDWFTKQADREDEIFLVAEKGEKIVGYLVGRVGKPAKVVRVAVDPRFRREGIGRQLVAFVLAYFKDQKVESVRAEIRVSNQASLKFFRGFHFRPQGKLKGYYRDGGDAHLLMLSF